ncbi:RusA family crossover junction endodeoxyribonuclease [Selenomonas sp. AB3002]|uniref:RusA family crossover junction endodeoxyribonuclease n=1 Tax=Selenomonas sp. AB3002 TaxID=1392502 RepID=UPI0004976D7A
MRFFMDINPPTATAQEKAVRMVNGRPIFYEPAPLKKAKATLMTGLRKYGPKEPMLGALELRTTWLFPTGKSHKGGEWRITRPDTDNLQKMLKDCMTKCGYWKDDAQVVREVVEKQWAEEPGIHIEIKSLTSYREPQINGEGYSDPTAMAALRNCQ